MFVRFWGTRGSIAKAGPSTLRYGGNTSCVEVRSDRGTIVMIDAGTGAHALGTALVEEHGGRPITGNILISHTHWDHIQGFPFFAPLFRPDDRWRVYGPRGLGSSLGETLAGQMQYSYFPVTIDQLGGVADYHDLVEGVFEIDDITVTTWYLNHPALALAYRLEADGVSFVYASDHEPHDRALAGGGDIATSHHDAAHAAHIEGADLLVHDSQYLASEFADKVGWGHSTVEYVVDVARHAGVAQLALFHHDPSRSDDEVDRVLEHARAHGSAGGFGGEVIAAAEGLRITLGGGRSVPGRRTSLAAMRATLVPALDDLPRSMLVAAKDEGVRDALRRVAEVEGVVLRECAPDGAEVVERIRDDHPSVVVLQGIDHTVDVVADIRRLPPPYGREVQVVTVGMGSADAGPAPSSPWTYRLHWPASAGYIRTKLHAWLLRRACRWRNAPLPADEDARLRTLRSLDVLDTPSEDRFDRLTATLSERLGVPIALVSLIDEDRQWFKSAVGIDATETPRDQAFCAHAILDGEVLQVPDALADDRFAENPLVTGEPHVRFYAGVPLTMSDGTRAGTLCAIDYRPRVLDDGQLAELRRLGEEVVRELEGR